MWEEKDKDNFNKLLKKGKGQICEDEFSKEIKKYASNEKFK